MAHEAGDVIVKIDGITVNSKSTFDERIAFLRPGDLVKLEVYRNKSKKDVEIVLVNDEGTTELLKRESVTSEVLGADFEVVSKLIREAYKIDSGIKVTNITNGKIRKMNISDGFIFLMVNGKTFDKVDELITYLEDYTGQVRIEGVAANGSRQYLSFSFR